MKAARNSSATLAALLIACTACAQNISPSCKVMIRATAVCMRDAEEQIQLIHPDAAQTLTRLDYTRVMAQLLQHRDNPENYCTSPEPMDALYSGMQALGEKYEVDPRLILTSDCRMAAKRLYLQIKAKHPDYGN